MEKENSHSIDVRFTYRLLIEKEFISSKMGKINKSHGDSMISQTYVSKRFESLFSKENLSFCFKRKNSFSNFHIFRKFFENR